MKQYKIQNKKNQLTYAYFSLENNKWGCMENSVTKNIMFSLRVVTEKRSYCYLNQKLGLWKGLNLFLL